MTELEAVHKKIDSLDDERAPLALEIVVEYLRLPVPTDDWARVEGQIGEAIAASDLDRYTAQTWISCSDGDLARSALHYYAESFPDSGVAIEDAIRYSREPGERFALETLALGALVLAVLQTDVKLSNKEGRWKFEVHKKAISDSALAKVITAFISNFTNQGK
jgi:hypothetical protein